MVKLMLIGEIICFKTLKSVNDFDNFESTEGVCRFILILRTIILVIDIYVWMAFEQLSFSHISSFLLFFLLHPFFCWSTSFRRKPNDVDIHVSKKAYPETFIWVKTKLYHKNHEIRFSIKNDKILIWFKLWISNFLLKTRILLATEYLVENQSLQY